MEAAEAALKDTELAQRTQIQLAEAAVESAKAAVIQADLNLGYTTVKAPITGIIGKVQVDRGNLVGKAEPTLLATVSAVDPIYVDFGVAEADYLRLAPRIRLDPGAGRRARGRRSNCTWPTTGSFRTRAASSSWTARWTPRRGTIERARGVPEPGRVLRPGQFARVRGVVEERADAVLVPQLAVQEQQGTKIVLVVEAGDKVALRPVTRERARRRLLHRHGRAQGRASA